MNLSLVLAGVWCLILMIKVWMSYTLHVWMSMVSQDWKPLNLEISCRYWTWQIHFILAVQRWWFHACKKEKYLTKKWRQNTLLRKELLKVKLGISDIIKSNFQGEQCSGGGEISKPVFRNQEKLREGPNGFVLHFNFLPFVNGNKSSFM